MHYGANSEVLKQYAAVAARKKPYWRRGVPHLACAVDCAKIEVVRLPLAEDGETIDMVLSVTIYFDAMEQEILIDRLKMR